MSLSDRYDEFYRSPGRPSGFPSQKPINRWPRDRVEAILADAVPGGTVLDIGCGDGGLLYNLRSMFSCLVGLEFSRSRLEQAASNLSGLSFRGVAGSAEEMNSIDSETIDCVVSADTIEHIPDVYAAVAEMFRVIRPGGVLVVNTPNIAFIKKRALLLLGRFPSTSQPNEGLGSDILFDGGHLHYFTYRSLRILLERTGFVVVGKRGYGKFGRLHNLYPSLLSGGVQLVARKPLLS